MKKDIQDRLSLVQDGFLQFESLFAAIGALAEIDAADTDTLQPLIGLGRAAAQKAYRDFEEVLLWCCARDKERIEREKLIADIKDTDEGQALRDLARDMAQKIDAICHPAMRAITQMQNKAGEIDDMVRRARDMAGCLRWSHSPDRDPNKPEVGTLRHTVEEAMVARRGSLSAVMERRAGQRSGLDQSDAR